MSSPATESPKQKGQDDESSGKVHSANSWETADLGDKQRNEKFLRLMGASKKEHHGKIVIGEKTPAHSRDKVAEAHLQVELEEQFSQGMEHRLAGGRRGHLGLGFHPEDKKDENKGGDQDTAGEGKPAAESLDSRVHEETGQTPEQKEKGDNLGREKDERKRESSDKDDAHEIKKLKFVKSSS